MVRRRNKRKIKHNTGNSKYICIFFIVFISFIFSPEKASTDEEDITQFIEPISGDEFNEESILKQLDSYDTGEVKSINKRSGEGVIETDEGDKYIMNIGEVIGKGGRSITVGEDVLFQKKPSSKERKVKNIIRVEEDSEKIGQYSKWLRKLAYDTKRLRKNINSYNNDYIEKKLNNCNAYSELLNDYATRNGIKLKLHEVILSNVIKRDLKNISRVMEENSKKVPWWVGLLTYVLKIISIVADFIQIASPSTGDLLRLVGKSIGKLLEGPKQPPQIGPGGE